MPVYNFQPTPYSMILKYVADAIPIEAEIGVVVLGQLSVIIVQSLFCLVSYASQLATGHFPSVWYECWRRGGGGGGAPLGLSTHGGLFCNYDIAQRAQSLAV